MNKEHEITICTGYGKVVLSPQFRLSNENMCQMLRAAYQTAINVRDGITPLYPIDRA